MAKEKVRNSTVQEQEVWKPVKGYEGIYEVSNKAKVRSFYKFKTNIVIDTPRIVKTPTNDVGYPVVTLCKNGKRENKHLHIIVAENFVPNPNNNPIVCHEDDIKTNCQPSNLYWGTHVDNAKDRKRNGKEAKGEELYNSVFSEEDVLYIRSSYKNGKTQVNLAKEYNVTRQAIWLIVHRKNWAHI